MAAMMLVDAVPTVMMGRGFSDDGRVGGCDGDSGCGVR